MDKSEQTNVYHYLLDQSKIPRKYREPYKMKNFSCDEDATKQLHDIRNSILDVVNDVPYNLVICGNELGNGKTSWAIRLLKNYLVELSSFNEVLLEEPGSVIHSIFVPTNQFVSDAKKFEKRERYLKYSDRIERAELVIFDDLGAAEYSKYDYNILYSAIDYRIMNGQFCIFTTNFTSEEDLGEVIGSRLANRVWRTSLIIELKGKGLRGLYNDSSD